MEFEYQQELDRRAALATEKVNQELAKKGYCMFGEVCHILMPEVYGPDPLSINDFGWIYEPPISDKE